MSRPDDTCWTMIEEAAGGDAAQREEFARVYEPVVRAYFHVRWRSSPLRAEIDDAVQELFFDCLRPNGALERFERGKGPGFRAFLYGVVRNVARRIEQKRRRSKERPIGGAVDPNVVPADDESLGTAFDRSWARALLREAGRRQEERAREKGAAAVERVRLLKLRFEEGLPIREIAKRWEADPARLHHMYATARKDFLRCLGEVVGFHDPGASREEIDRECRRLLELTT